ncbi:MAG TPA: hypothetical protein VKD72_13135 [Gemmataceae bacterium]|nr:hypothetical protein [Gemmataceae bacterium]
MDETGRPAPDPRNTRAHALKNKRTLIYSEKGNFVRARKDRQQARRLKLRLGKEKSR